MTNLQYIPVGEIRDYRFDKKNLKKQRKEMFIKRGLLGISLLILGLTSIALLKEVFFSALFISIGGCLVKDGIKKLNY